MADEMEYVEKGLHAGKEVAGGVARGAGGFLSGIFGVPAAAAKGAFNGGLRNTVWYALALGAVTFSGALKPLLNIVGKGEWADRLADKLKPENGGMPAVLTTLLGAGAATAATIGGVKGAIGEITGTADATPEGVGMGLGGVLTLAAGAAVAIGAVMHHNDASPAPTTPSATPPVPSANGAAAPRVRH